MPAGTKKNPAPVALGRLGGKKRAANLSAQELSDQGKRAAAARWAKSDAEPGIPVGSANPEPLGAGDAALGGRDSNVILALKEQGYEVGEPVLHPDGFTRVDVRSQEVSAWVSVGQELLNLATGKVTMEEITNRRRSEQRNVAAAGQG